MAAANPTKYYTRYNWTYTECPADPKDPSQIKATWVSMDAPITLTNKQGDSQQFYFNDILQMAVQEGKYFVMTHTIDNTQIDGTAYQYYGSSGWIPIIQSVRQQIKDEKSSFLK